MRAPRRAARRRQRRRTGAPRLWARHRLPRSLRRHYGSSRHRHRHRLRQCLHRIMRSSAMSGRPMRPIPFSSRCRHRRQCLCRFIRRHGSPLPMPAPAAAAASLRHRRACSAACLHHRRCRQRRSSRTMAVGLSARSALCLPSPRRCASPPTRRPRSSQHLWPLTGNSSRRRRHRPRRRTCPPLRCSRRPRRWAPHLQAPRSSAAWAWTSRLHRQGPRRQASSITKKPCKCLSRRVHCSNGPRG
uniref:Uncharacterized protein n=1 Tax=Arundo donax TaxID=35708 RepID=A0A0A9CNV0_ARUDO